MQCTPELWLFRGSQRGGSREYSFRIILFRIIILYQYYNTICILLFNLYHTTKMQRRLAEEYERCQQYLDAATRRPLVAAAEAQLLQRHMGALLEKGFDALMAAQRVPDLARWAARAGQAA